MSLQTTTTIVAASIVTASAVGQQFQDASSTRFPSPDPLDYSNQLTIGDLDNDGTGMFTLTSGVIQVINDSSLDIGVADLTGDGKLDIVTAQGESGSYRNTIYVNNGPSDDRGPRIIATEQVPSPADTTGPYIVRAAILDDVTSDRNFFDRGIRLHYTVNKGTTVEVDMRHSGGQVYRGEIPGQPDGSTIEYYVTALDHASNLGTGTSREFEIEGIPGDINGDGVVDVVDLLDLLIAWGDCPEPPETCPADFDGSGTVTVVDLLVVLANWS